MVFAVPHHETHTLGSSSDVDAWQTTLCIAHMPANDKTSLRGSTVAVCFLNPTAEGAAGYAD